MAREPPPRATKNSSSCDFTLLQISTSHHHPRATPPTCSRAARGRRSRRSSRSRSRRQHQMTTLRSVPRRPIRAPSRTDLARQRRESPLDSLSVPGTIMSSRARSERPRGAGGGAFGQEAAERRKKRPKNPDIVFRNACGR
ncbi:hypothetical protein MPTK1_1g21250 [Marchantia polymorpha subsp. ruderalis]|uniref:Uncharacterized protein n=2 Tax=Marchantia polymorpha TaxID=3197 RepID=A0AAF6ASK9_MARPO|nr:hypothetical protein MARPO_0001s0459 [Marchantia polymorpha]BBM99429.1 hypothetical protein Mp_1g21250 [Marchantia polymorpha subsp. ruderalis]|eukprot:PTQ50510.1 hypothetical protein MARPO_0001s0459 [Marchantia polymorpha]